VPPVPFPPAAEAAAAAAGNLSAIEQEAARLAALEKFDVLDTPREASFDRIARLAKRLFDVPVAIVSFIDAHRQWYKAHEGAAVSEVPREQTFCRHVIEGGKPLVVPDARNDARFRDNVHVLADPGVRFYAGVPLRTRDGFDLGSLCIIDTAPRNFDAEQLGLMEDLAGMALDELELRLCATTDGLTGVMTRRAFRQEAARLVALATRHGHELACIALDVDRFKAINDGYGHAGGDAVLRGIVSTMTERIRTTDLVGRMGGEEFAILLPNTAEAGALDVAEKVRAAIAATPVQVGGERIGVTASFGVASLGTAVRDLDTLIAHADQALYDAKRAGRNRVSAWSGDPVAADPAERSVLKAGKLVLDEGARSIDCTVQRLSDKGAGIAVNSAREIPNRFVLAIPADRLERPCRVVRRSPTRLGVAFTG
jgi:diguanylate cyclase (GGDEF)-like protein